MTIEEINKMLGTNYSSIVTFEKNATWETDIKGESINSTFAKQFSHKIDWDYFSRNYNLSEVTIRANQDNVNWDYISTYRTLSESFIREFKDSVSWWCISKYQNLSESFIIEFKDKITWPCITSKQKLSENFIETYLKEGLLDWSYTLEHQKLSENFILKHIDKFDIRNVCRHQTISENTIVKFINELDFDTILMYQDVSQSFIEKYFKEINWKSISGWIDKNIKDEIRKERLLEKYTDYLDWFIISSYWVLNVNIVRKFRNKFQWNIINVRSSLSEEFIREFQDEVDWRNISQNCIISEEFIEEFIDKVDWTYIGKDIEYSLKFIRKHKDKLKKAKISTNDLSIIRELKDCISFKEINYMDFSEELLYEFRDKVNWESLIKYKKLSETLFDKVAEFFGEWEWRWLSDIQPLSENFIRKYKDKVQWEGICCHQILTEEFIEEFDINNQPFTFPSNNIPIYYEGKLCSPFHVSWKNILKYQKLSSDFSKKISSLSWSKRKYLMLPYQKNDFTNQLLNTLSEEDKKKYLADTWLYKSTDFRKEHVANLKVFECFDNYFITSILADTNRYLPYYYHYQFEKNKTFEIFATQTDERSVNGYERVKGFIVGSFENLIKHYRIDTYHSNKKYNPLKVKVFYEDVARIVLKEAISGQENPIVRCNKLYVLD